MKILTVYNPHVYEKKNVFINLGGSWDLIDFGYIIWDIKKTVTYNTRFF